MHAATERAITRWQAGASIYAASRAEGIAYTTLWRAIRRLGLTRSVLGVTMYAATERAIARWQAGSSIYAASRAEGIAYSTLWRAIRRLGLTRSMKE